MSAVTAALARRRAYESVHALLSDDHNDEQGLAALRDLTRAVVVESGGEGAADLAIELSLKLAEALERIAAECGLSADELAEVWFVG
ncbi:MAG: hypothetical protein ABW212_19040 [Pseudonocardia sediminis]